MSEMIMGPVRKLRRSPDEEVKRNKQEWLKEIARIESAMKLLFNSNRINNDVVLTYNNLEAKWKKLTNYQEL